MPVNFTVSFAKMLKCIFQCVITETLVRQFWGLELVFCIEIKTKVALTQLELEPDCD